MGDTEADLRAIRAGIKAPKISKEAYRVSRSKKGQVEEDEDNAADSDDGESIMTPAAKKRANQAAAAAGKQGTKRKAAAPAQAEDEDDDEGAARPSVSQGKKKSGKGVIGGLFAKKEAPGVRKAKPAPAAAALKRTKRG